MSDLLKEAIADAKAVRETALANAKMALEEAFTPHLKSMLSAKLAEDEYEEDEEDIAVDDEEDEDAEEMSRQYREDDDEEMDIEPEDGEEEDDEYEEGISEEDIIEIDGVKYAPIVTEEDEDDNPFAKKDDEEEEEDDEIEELDLEAVIKELEDELSEDEEVEEDESVNEVDEDEELDEYSGTVAQKRKKSGNAPRINNEEVEEDLTESDPDEEEKVVKEDSEKVDEDDEKDETNESETSELQNELNEYKEAVTFLRDKLHEVNILNAKLLYTNKLFKEYVLSNDQKLKIVETFDRAQTTREIKLVYTTLAESFKPGEGEKKNAVVKEFASKKSGGTAPKTKIITEESQVANRFRKLAGIL